MELEKIREELVRNNLQISRLISDMTSEKETRAEGNKLIYQKLDKIIERNATADQKISVLMEQVMQHTKEDDEEFKSIKRKHENYDKFIIGSLVWAVTQLLTLIGIFAFK